MSEVLGMIGKSPKVETIKNYLNDRLLLIQQKQIQNMRGPHSSFLLFLL